jgi:hypothetical protein
MRGRVEIATVCLLKKEANYSDRHQRTPFRFPATIIIACQRTAAQSHALGLLLVIAVMVIYRSWKQRLWTLASLRDTQSKDRRFQY